MNSNERKRRRLIVRAVIDHSNPQCKCNGSGYCDIHGTFTPTVSDPEVLEAMENKSASHSARPVIRKPLDK